MSFLISPIIVFEASANGKIGPWFNVDILCPNTDRQIIESVLLIADKLELIGINVNILDITDLDNIAIRTSQYPLVDYDYIPTYGLGGYDIMFLFWSMSKDLNLRGRFDTSWCDGPLTDIYQYVNPIYDNKYDYYESAYDPLERESFAHELQEILYEDLPAISIFDKKDLFLFNDNVTGINLDLLKIRSHHPENWEKSDGLELIIASKYSMSTYNIFDSDVIGYSNDDINFDSLWIESVYGSLFRRNSSNFLWEPYIAKNATIEIHPNNMSVIVDLNPDAKFSNGDPVLVEDIKYTYDLLLSPEVPYHFASKYLWDDLVTIVDSDTIRFDYYTVYNFPYSLLSYGIIEKSLVEPLISTYGYDILYQSPFSENITDELVTSCGPYALANYSLTENKVEVVKNEYWFGSPQKTHKITFLSIPSKEDALFLLTQGDIDILDSTYDFLISEITSNGFNDLPFYGLYNTPITNLEMALNQRHPVFGTGELTPVGTANAAKYIRHAISYTIPRPIIIDEIMNEQATPGVTSIPPGCIGYNSELEPYTYDLDTAIGLIEDAGFTEICCRTDDTSYAILIPFIIGLAGLYFIKREKIKN